MHHLVYQDTSKRRIEAVGSKNQIKNFDELLTLQDKSFVGEIVNHVVAAVAKCPAASKNSGKKRKQYTTPFKAAAICEQEWRVSICCC